MSKRVFIIAGAVVIALIFLVLILLVIMENKNPTRKVDFSMSSNSGSNGIVPPTTEVTVTTTPEKTEPKDEREKINGEISYAQTEDGGIIPVPPTFAYAGGASQYGAVIVDENGNEFVWVPVENYNSYARQLFANNGQEENKDKQEEETLESLRLRDVNDYNSVLNDSVKNYKGFYIARFEAGKEVIDGKNYAISKPSIVPWTQISWKAAKEASKNMYVDNEYFLTDLISSYAWDTTCNWLRSTGVNIDNSVDYGNYQNSYNGLNRVTETASNNRWQTNNIYDMAGNAWEYTTEESGDHDRYHIGRGGGYLNEGNVYPISARAISEDTPNLAVSFRVVLYLK